jgi:fused signal recognition particle receptor
MFGGLKEKLQAVRDRLGNSIQGAADTQAAAPTTTETVAGAATKKTISHAGPTLADKVKVLITDRELIISDKDISEALSELEMTLLASDVALPVSDAIIAHVDESGRTRKDRPVC